VLVFSLKTHLSKAHSLSQQPSLRAFSWCHLVSILYQSWPICTLVRSEPVPYNCLHLSQAHQGPHWKCRVCGHYNGLMEGISVVVDMLWVFVRHAFSLPCSKNLVQWMMKGFPTCVATQFGWCRQAYHCAFVLEDGVSWAYLCLLSVRLHSVMYCTAWMDKQYAICDNRSIYCKNLAMLILNMASAPVAHMVPLWLTSPCHGYIPGFEASCHCAPGGALCAPEVKCHVHGANQGVHVWKNVAWHSWVQL